MDITPRRPLHPVQNGSCSPRQPHGSPIRHSSPNPSGSNDENTEGNLVEIDDSLDITASPNSTLNSSTDVADGDGFKISYKETDKSLKFFPNGNLKEVTYRKTTKQITLQNKEEPRNFILLWVVMVVLVALCGIYYHSNFVRDVAPENKSRQRPPLVCSFERLKSNFPNQNEILWRSLKYGVESVLNDIPTSPSVFLLAYEDVNSANKITRSIVERTTECMDSKVNALVLSPADLEGSEMKSDYGVVIAKYQNQLKKSGVMLVNDLNKIHSKVAPAFHVFCDVHNPLVDRSIIFLTLQLSREYHSSSNALQLVENYLRSNWSEIENYVLEPLITRVTDQVFVLNKE